MVGAATFHAVATELVVGSLSIAVLATILRCIATFSNPLARKAGAKVLSGLDAASLWAAGFGFSIIPFAIITGYLAAGDAASNPQVINKMILSGLCAGLWIGFIYGRMTLGPGLWNHRRLAVVQTFIAFLAIEVTYLLGSIGGLLARGEAIMDILPFFPHFENAPEISTFMSVVLMLIGLVTLLVVIFLQPKPQRITELVHNDSERLPSRLS